VLRLRYERLSLGVSQNAIGLAARIPQPTFSSIEIGRLKPTPAQLQRLAEVFHVTPAEELLKDVVVLRPSR
jgi:transcriptional regulator with XRE-family HTH domain